MRANSTHLSRRLPRLPIPGLFTRLSHFIMVQVVFVFAAVAVVVFLPTGSGDLDSDLTNTRSELQILVEDTRRVLRRWEAPADNPDQWENAASALRSVFLQSTSVEEARIFEAIEGRGRVPVFTYRRTRTGDATDQEPLRLDLYLDGPVIDLGLSQPDLSPISQIGSDARMIHYCPCRVREDRPAVLVAVTDHDLMISSRSETEYALLLLFLGSVLVSLLMIHLISHRFKGPLDRLIHGLEKTAAGELFYLFEAGGDRELRRLVSAFNAMSEALWRNHRSLHESNYRLAEANRSLIQSQLFLATLIESSPTAVIVTGPDGKIMIFNRKASRLFECDSSEVIGRPVEGLLAKGKRLHELTPESTSPLRSEVLCRRSDGTIFPAYLTASPVSSRDDRTAAILFLIRDISESKSFQEMMIRLDRYYTRGEMAGDIAHEMNNYLAVLSGNIELLPLLLKKGETEKATGKLAVMKQTVDKIARFANGLMDTDPDRLTLTFADLNQVVENTVAFLKPQNKFDRIDIVTTPSGHLHLALVDVGQMEQLLVNLLNNAAEALRAQPGRPEIRITTSHIEQGADGGMQIEVRDNGPGIPEENQGLVFVKRFTTKRRGHGLGLITCRKIVDGHRGTILYRTDRGAVFTITIPLRQSPDPAKPTDISAGAVSPPAR